MDLLAVSPDELLAVGARSSGPTVALWNIEDIDPRLIRNLESNCGNFTEIRFSADGTRVIALCHGAAIFSWQLSGDRQSPEVASLPGRVQLHDWSGDGRRIVIARQEISPDGYPVHVVDASNGLVVGERTVRSDGSIRVCISSDARTVLYSFRDPEQLSRTKVVMWDVEEGSERIHLPGDDWERVTALALSDELKSVIVGLDNGFVEVVPLHCFGSGTNAVQDCADRFQAHRTSVKKTGWIGGTRLYSLDERDSLSIWETGADVPKKFWTLPKPVSCVSLPTRSKVAVTAYDRSISIWDTAEKIELQSFLTDAQVTECSMTADGTRILALDAEGKLRLHRVS